MCSTTCVKHAKRMNALRVARDASFDVDRMVGDLQMLISYGNLYASGDTLRAARTLYDLLRRDRERTR